MAGRIRSIKPEIIEDGRSGCLSNAAWRLWVSMWLIADDHGNLRAHPSQLHGQVFWAELHAGVQVAELLEELEAAGSIQRYQVKGQQYAHVNNWEKHQRLDNAGTPRVPRPDDPSAESLREPPRPAANRGSDLRSPTTITITTTDPDHERDHRARARNRGPRSASKIPEHLRLVASALLQKLNEARKRVVPGAGDLGPQDPNLEHIADRLKDGYSESEIDHVIAVSEAEVKAGGPAIYFDAVTPFRRANFSKRLAMTPETAAKPRGVANGTNGNSVQRAAAAQAPRPPVKPGEGGEVKL